MTTNEENGYNILDKYPRHKEALLKAGHKYSKSLQTKTPPTRKIKENVDGYNSNGKSKAKRKLFFKVKYSKFFKVPIHVIIKRNLKIFSLDFVKFSMCYKRYPNFGEIISGDIKKKLVKAYKDENFDDLKCNCRGGEAKCILEVPCGMTNVVYELGCKVCGNDLAYDGSTARRIKTRYREHVYDVRAWIKNGLVSDSFSRHFAGHCNAESSVKDIRELIEVKILGKITNGRGYGTDFCGLCSLERLTLIRRHMRGIESINGHLEVCFTCKHKRGFPRWKLR